MTSLTKREYDKLMGKSNSKGTAFLIILSVIIIIAVLVIIKIWVAMTVWNLMIPSIFGLPTITFWQMFGLDVLINLLFNANKFNYGNKK